MPRAYPRDAYIRALIKILKSSSDDHIKGVPLHYIKEERTRRPLDY